MSEAKHTPGPWKASIAGSGRLIIQGGIEGLNAHDTNPSKFHCIAEMYRPLGPSVNESADARLMAAAPDILAALRGLMNLIETGKLLRNTRDDAEPDFAIRHVPFVMGLKAAVMAIEKAEGRTI